MSPPPSFYFFFLFCSWILPKIPQCTQHSWLCRLLFIYLFIYFLLWKYLISSFLITLLLSKSTAHVFCRKPLNWKLIFFLMIRLRLWVFWRKTTEVKCYFHYITSRLHNVNMTSLSMLTLITWRR